MSTPGTIWSEIFPVHLEKMYKYVSISQPVEARGEVGNVMLSQIIFPVKQSRVWLGLS